MNQKELSLFEASIVSNRFLGIASDIDFNNFNEETITTLIDRNVYVLAHNDFPDFEMDDSNSFSFHLYLNNIFYQINPIIIAEVYGVIRYFVEDKICLSECFVEDLMMKTYTLPGRKSKKKFLKKKYKKMFPKDEGFLVYSTLVECEGVLFDANISWYEHVKDFLTGEEGQIMINTYLNYKREENIFRNETDFLYEIFLQFEEIGEYEFDELKEQWLNYYEKEFYLLEILSCMERVGKLKKKSEFFNSSKEFSFMDEMDGYDDDDYDYDYDNVFLNGNSHFDVFNSQGDVINYSEESQAEMELSEAGFSALEAAYYIYFTEYVNEVIIDDKMMKKDDYWNEIGKIFKCSGANVRNNHGKILRDKNYRRKPTMQRIKILKKVLPFLSEKAKVQCEIIIEKIEINF